MLAMAATAVLAGLAGWQLASVPGAAPTPQQPPAPRTAPATVSAPASRTVDVNGGALAGLPARAVRQRLSQLGLAPRVAWVPSAQHPPGTVISVRPAGQLPPGTTVTVTVAYRPHHQHGNGQGNNGGD